MRSGESPRVAYVLKMYPRLAETFILNEILAHEAAGLDLEVFSLRPPVDGRFHQDLARVQADVVYVPGQSVKTELFWTTVCEARRELPALERILQDDPPETAANVHQAILLARAVRERRVVHMHAHFATLATNVVRLASLMTGIPYSFTAHAKDIYDESVEEHDLRRKLRDAAAVVTVSDYNLQYLSECFGEDAARVRRIYNGLDLDEFAFTAPDDREPLVAGVGRLVEKKGWCDLVDACAILARSGRRFKCQIIGGGALRPRLDKQIEALGLGDHVEMLGPRPRGEVNRRVARSAVLAAPCVVAGNGNRDGLPTVLLEAMALGTPCVSTPVTGIPEAVRDGETGLLVNEHDPPALAGALERLLDDRALRVRLAAGGRRLVEAEFDIHRNTVTLREILLSASAGKPRVALEVG